MAEPVRIGLVGFGFIGAQVYQRIAGQPALGLQVAFVWNRSPARLSDVPEALRLANLSDCIKRAPDLVIELAHPAITREYGSSILKVCDYMPLSVSALVDQGLEDNLREIAEANGTRLLIPHGALVGVDSLVEGRENWRDVTITFEKHPSAIDFTESGSEPPKFVGRTVVFEGSAREIGMRFPRNVNTMVTCGLATVGLDRCRARLIADPALEVGIAQVDASGFDGATLHWRKEQPMAGVSGTEMFASLFGSVLRATGARRAVDFV
jgi:predicted dinucleotide-utilizing enzyme